MPQWMDHKQVFTLLEVNKSIQKVLSERYTRSFWVKAEMNKLNFYKHSGHCYPELVEKRDGKIIAQCKALLWKDDFQRINRHFLEVLHEPLQDGIKILFEASISFDTVHGLALWITDIDPGFTLGDLEREKQETIRQLKEEGIFGLNKSLSLPLLPKRIAVISVETSKGYADFVKVLDKNPWHYSFSYYLFPSLLQGDKAVDDMIRQLRRIKKVLTHFDMVAIIRGGGGDVGLSCFNNYHLAREIALYPIPVMTGIGHATNETVCEMIAYTNAITPTQLAEFLLQKFHNFSVPVQEAQRKIVQWSQQVLLDGHIQLHQEMKLCRTLSEQMLMRHQVEWKHMCRLLIDQSRFNYIKAHEHLRQQKHALQKAAVNQVGQQQNKHREMAWMIKREVSSLLRLANQDISMTSADLGRMTKFYVLNQAILFNQLEKNLEHLHPSQVLKRGYSITLKNGKSIQGNHDVKPGDIIETILYEGRIISKVDKT